MDYHGPLYNCPQCGRLIPIDSSNCPQCGSALTPLKLATKDEPKNPEIPQEKIDEPSPYAPKVQKPDGVEPNAQNANPQTVEIQNANADGRKQDTNAGTAGEKPALTAPQQGSDRPIQPLRPAPQPRYEEPYDDADNAYEHHTNWFPYFCWTLLILAALAVVGWFLYQTNVANQEMQDQRTRDAYEHEENMRAYQMQQDSIRRADSLAEIERQRIAQQRADSIANSSQFDGVAISEPQEQEELYYIVVGSAGTYEEAYSKLAELPSSLSNSRIYRYEQDGTVYFRICCACYEMQEDAESEVEGVRDIEPDAWVWAADGTETCVHNPSST